MHASSGRILSEAAVLGTFFWKLARNSGLPEFSKGNTLWVAPACADCPGFLVLDSAPAPASTFISELQIAPLG